MTEAIYKEELTEEEMNRIAYEINRLTKLTKFADLSAVKIIRKPEIVFVNKIVDYDINNDPIITYEVELHYDSYYVLIEMNEEFKIKMIMVKDRETCER
jgi:hypothetical protein